MSYLRIENRAGQFLVWNEPDDRKRYVIGADVATGKVKDINAQRRRPGMFGTGRDRPDYSAAIVLDLDTCEHVASWHGYIEPFDFAAVLAAIGYCYAGKDRKALIVPEVNGPGIAVVDSLVQHIRYGRIYQRMLYNRVEGDQEGSEWGFMTTQSTRPILISRLQAAVSDGTLKTFDADLIDEMRTMEFDEKGTARARGRNKDDRVLAAALALQGRAEILFGKDPTRRDPGQDLPDYDRRAWKKAEELRKQNERDRHPGTGLVRSRFGGRPRLGYGPQHFGRGFS